MTGLLAILFLKYVAVLALASGGEEDPTEEYTGSEPV